MTNPPPPFDSSAPRYATPPPPRRGIIPFHPIDFGTLFTASFAVIRHNPKLLLGATVALPLAVAAVCTGAFVALIFANLPRPNTFGMVSESDSLAMLGVMAISIPVVAIVMFVVTLLAQGIVTANSRAAILGERERLSAAWRRVKPAFWKLVGFTLLYAAMILGIFAVFVAVVLLIISATSASSDTAAVLGSLLAMFLFILLAIPLVAWLSTKLLLAPSIIVYEGTDPTAAIARSWRLTRGRFWVAFGITAILGAMASVAGYIAGLPASIAPYIVAPGLMMDESMMSESVTEMDSDASTQFTTVVGAMLVLQLLPLAVQFFGTALQGTAASIVYVDARMRNEGLAQSLQWYAAQREAGVPADQLPDPFAPASSSPAPTPHAPAASV